MSFEKKNQDEITIQRCPHDGENPYAQISRDLIRDTSISPECRWMIIYLLSMKDGWNINIQQIINHLNGFAGRDKVYAIINEAIESGYMQRIVTKKGNLKQETSYVISETPKFKKILRHPDFQYPESRDPENTHIKNKHIPKKEHIEKKQQQAPKGAAVVLFEFIKEIGLTEKEQKTLMKYPEEEVKSAVYFATHPTTNIKTTLIKTIMWALKEKPEVPQPIDEEANFKLACYVEDHYSSETWKLEALSSKVTLISKNPNYTKVHEINYNEQNFEIKLKNVLKECRFVKNSGRSKANA